MSSQRKILCRVLSRTFHRDGLPSLAKKTIAPIPLIREDQFLNRSFPNFYNNFATTLRCSIKPIRVRNNNSKMIWRLIKIMIISRRMRYGLNKCRDINKVRQQKLRVLLSRRRAMTESLICTNSYRTLSTCHWTALSSRSLSSCSSRWGILTTRTLAWTARSSRCRWPKNNKGHKPSIITYNI